MDLGLDAMVWLAFMAGGGSSRSEDRKGEQVCDEERTVFFVF